MNSEHLPILIVINLVLSIIVIPIFIGEKREIGYAYSALACVFLSPIIGLAITLASKKNERTLRKEMENSLEFKKDLSVKNNLLELKLKGIITEEEYKQKTEKLEATKTKQNLENSTEYKQLSHLFASGILTKEEFENKVNLLLKNKKE